ncbi:hypothetical protein NE237_025503 [Protea cynaroides]|uniref:Uncharacterized protein n=1 Tax=Protea cynaroides TaxID=273540 RepID=A0A9Q0H6D1_9MAGN|nr:hypothetical protein NE237_025503 [Protea cynaroides]
MASDGSDQTETIRQSETDACNAWIALAMASVGSNQVSSHVNGAAGMELNSHSQILLMLVAPMRFSDAEGLFLQSGVSTGQAEGDLSVMNAISVLSHMCSSGVAEARTPFSGVDGGAGSDDLWCIDGVVTAPKRGKTKSVKCHH